MPASSLRNAVKRKTHKERAQPAGRKKLGLLEKKKDYQLRAKDYAFKRKRLEALRLKAELRNHDEYYTEMAHAKTRNGVHVVDNADPAPSSDVLKLIRTQNLGYVQTKLQHEKHTVDRLKESLHFVGASKPSHTIFVDDDEERETFDPVEYFDTAPAFVNKQGHHHNRLTKSQLKTLELSSQPVTSANKESEKAYGALNSSLSRIEALDATANHISLKKALLGKGKRWKIKDAEGDKPALYKWKNERKR